MQTIFNTDEREATIFFSTIYEADVTTVWNCYTNPDLLSQWWMPKPWNFELISQNFAPEGQLLYAAVGPDGEKNYSGQTYNEINQNRSISLSNYFTDESGNTNHELPVADWLIGFTGVEQGTKLTVNIHFKNAEDLNKTLAMGFKEGFTQTAEQLRTILTESN